MRNMLRSIAAAILLVLASTAGASAQCSGQAPAGTYCGNPLVSQALPGWKVLSALAPNWITPQSLGFACTGTPEASIMQTAVNALPALGGTIYIPPGSNCQDSSFVTINKPNVTILGASKATGNGAIVNNNTSKVNYTGTNARYIDARSITGFNLINVNLTYSDATSALTKLVDYGSNNIGVTFAAYGMIQGNMLGPDTNRTGTATLLSLSENIDTAVDQNFFYHGKPAIQGQSTLGYNTVAKITKNVFSVSETISINGCGEGWVVENNSFEPLASGAAGAFTNTVGLSCFGGSWSGNWYGDVTANGGTWVSGYFRGTAFSGEKMTGKAVADSTIGFDFKSSDVSFIGGYFDAMQTVMKLTASTLSVKGGYVTSGTGTFIDCSGGTNLGVSINNVLWGGGPPTFIGTAASCGALNTDENNPTATQATTGQVRVGQGAADPLWKTMSGDATLVASGAVTLASTITAGGPTGSATVAPIITYDAKGRLTAVSSATITPAVGSITGLGTGVATALGINVGSAGAFVTFNGAGGTPSSITLTNGTGLPTTGLTGTLQAAQEPAHTGDVTNSAGSLALTIANNAVTLAKLATQATNTVLGNATSGTAVPTALAVGSCSTASSALIWTTNTGFGCNTSITAAAVAVGGITGLGTGVATWLATPSSANLIAAVTDETGTGALVFANTPTLVTPNIGAATGTSVNLTSTVTAAGLNHSFGPGGTGASVVSFIANGGSATGGGAQFAFQRNSTSNWLFAHTSAISGDTNNNLGIYNFGITAYALQFSAADSSITFGSTINATSGTVGAINTLGGIGVTKDAWIGAKIFAPNLATTTAALGAAVCWTTTTGEFQRDTNAGGCLVSNAASKHAFERLDLSRSYETVMAAKPYSFLYNDNVAIGRQIGFKADDFVDLDKRLVGFGASGKVQTFRYQQYTAELTAAFQHRVRIEEERYKELKADNDNLRAEVRKMQGAR